MTTICTLKPEQLNVEPGGDLMSLPDQFADCCDPTLAVEVENFLVSESDGRPLPIFGEVRDRLPAKFQDQIHEEFLQSQIEYATRPHLQADSLRRELLDYVSAAQRAAGALNAKLAWRATIADLRIEASATTRNERTQTLLTRFGSLAENLATCGLHVHVGVARDAAIQVVDAMTTFVPLFVAMSANSPRISTRNDAAASQRAAVWAHSFPTSGFPMQFGDWDGFLSHVQVLQRAGVIEKQKDIYHFVRPTRHGTVEIRCCDLPSSPDMVINLAALTQALVAAVQKDQTLRLPVETLHADLVNAVRFGRNAQLTGFDGRRLPVSELLEAVVGRLKPVVAGLQTSHYLRRLQRAVANGQKVAPSAVPAVPTKPTDSPGRLRLPQLLRATAIFASGCMLPLTFS